MYSNMDDKHLYDKVIKCFRESLSALSSYHAEWREFDDFYLAKHWQRERASWRPDPVVNYISYIIDQKAPQITNQRPTGVILPTTEEDAEIAQIYTQLTDVIANRVDLDMRIDEVVRTGMTLDIGWFKVYWDNTIRGGNAAKKNVYIGDIMVESVDPSNIYFDTQATRVEDCRYIIFSVPKSVKWLKETWNVEIDAESVFETEIYNRPENNSSVSDRVNFYEYWYKEKGTVNVIYAAGGKILKHIKGVYRHGRYPFIPFVSKKRRNSILGISDVRNIMSNQKLLNKLVEIPTTNALLIANPISLVQQNSGIDPYKWTSKPGQIYQVKDINNSVKWLQPPEISGDIYRMIDLMTGFMERIGGVYDANTGETPGSVTAAAAIQMLQEQGSIPIKGIARNLYASLKEVYEQMIELIKEFYTEDRFIRVDTNNGGYKFMVFNSTEHQEIDFDIKVSGDNGTPATKAYISTLAADLFANGVLLPSEYVELQENLPNKDRIIARLREQESAAQQQQMAQNGGQMPPEGGQIPADMGMPMEAGGMPEMGGLPSIEEILQDAPPDIIEQVNLMRADGLNDEEILKQLAQMTG